MHRLADPRAAGRHQPQRNGAAERGAGVSRSDMSERRRAGRGIGHRNQLRALLDNELRIGWEQSHQLRPFAALRPTIVTSTTIENTCNNCSEIRG
jgi:hypothetical protein